MHELGGRESILLDYTQDKVAVVAPDGTYSYVSRAAETILGFAPADLVGTEAFEYMHPDDVARVRVAFAEFVDSEGFTEATVEYRHRNVDGDYVWLESRCSNYTDDELGGYIVSSRDVTDRVEAEQARDETATRLRELAEQTSDVLWVFSGDWSELLFVNSAFERMYGGDADRLEGDPTRFLDCIHPEDVDRVRTGMERLSAGESIDLEYRVDADRGYGTWVWVQAEPIIEDGEVVRIVGFARDVTDRRRRERQLVVIDNILRHNLRNDLNTILGYADLIVDDPSTAEANAEVIRQVGRDLLETAEKQRDINDLFSCRVRPEPVDLHDEVADAVGLLTDRYPVADIDLDVPDPLPARAVPQIEVAVTELVENGIKHAHAESPTVEVAGGTREDHAIVEISDECPPIPESEYRVLNGTSEMDQVYHSTGLGLWLAYWLVDLSDGHIEFSRSERPGNTVTLSLPLPGA